LDLFPIPAHLHIGDHPPDGRADLVESAWRGEFGRGVDRARDGGRARGGFAVITAWTKRADRRRPAPERERDYSGGGGNVQKAKAVGAGRVGDKSSPISICSGEMGIGGREDRPRIDMDDKTAATRPPTQHKRSIHPITHPADERVHKVQRTIAWDGTRRAHADQVGDQQVGDLVVALLDAYGGSAARF
jgi:hypothetical protein